MKDLYVVIEREGSTWGATVPELPGIGVIGNTKEELLRNVREAIEDYFAAAKELGLSIPTETVVERVAVAV